MRTKNQISAELNKVKAELIAISNKIEDLEVANKSYQRTIDAMKTAKRILMERHDELIVKIRPNRR